MALSFCPSLRGTGRPGSVEQWRCHCPGCIRSDPGPYLPPASSFSSEVLSACSPASQLWQVSARSSYPASGSVRLAPPAVGGAHWHRLRLRPAPGRRRTGWAAPLHHLETRMAAGSQRPLSLGRRGAWQVSLQGYGVSDTWYQVPPGWVRCGPDGQLVSRREQSRFALLGVGWLAPARVSQLVPARLSEADPGKRVKWRAHADLRGAPKAHPGLLISPFDVVRLPHPVPMVLNNLRARFSDSSCAGTKQVGRTPWCCGGGPPAFLARSQRILPHVLASLLRDSPLLNPSAL